MKAKNILVSLVAVFALAVIFSANVSAFGTIDTIKASGFAFNVFDGTNRPVAVEAGQTVPVEVFFTANDDVKDVRIKIWTSGGKEYLVVSDRFDTLKGNSYSRIVSVPVPTKLDNPGESVFLHVSVESENKGSLPLAKLALTFQREPYVVDFLDVEMDSTAKAGEKLPITVVLKNRGSHLAEDTFVRARIAALGIEERSYFGDLSSVDQSNPDKEDSAERMLFLSIPANAKNGVYNVEIEVYNDDVSETVNKKISLEDVSGETIVVPSSTSKTFNAGDKGVYSITLVNSGAKVKIYSLVVESPSADLQVSALEPVVVVPAGTSRNVNIEASSSQTGNYAFSVSVNSDGALVKKENFAAKIEGKKSVEGNVTLVLTVILAIVFVVLLIVLIVLLTRKPEKKELGESYY